MGDRIARVGGPSMDVVMAIAALGAALLALLGDWDSLGVVSVVGAAVGLVPWALLLAGRSLPLAWFAGLGLVGVWMVVVAAENPGGMFPAMVLVVWVLRSGDRAVTAVVLVVSSAAIVAHAIDLGTAHETGLVYFLGGIAISALSGLLLRRQEVLTAELAAMGALQVEHAAGAERERIAREVHDIVAHSLTVVMLHVSGARRLLASDPVRAADALDRAEEIGRESLEQIRGVIGVLRSTDGTDPGLADLTDLVERFRAGGLDVAESIVLADPAAVDPTTGLVAYRIVQEALSNAVQHAAGAAIVVGVRLAEPDGGLRIDVANGPGGAASAVSGRPGLGVRGMGERVRALGGTFAAGPTADGGWRVSARLPVRPPVRTGRVAPGVAVP
jgi:signal transduction histidine kinase